MAKIFSFRKLIVFILPLILVYCTKPTEFKEGLVGVYYSDPDLSGPKIFNVINKLDQQWGKENGFSAEWSAEWSGFFISPYDGEVNIHISTNKKAKLIISGKDTLEIRDGEDEKVAKINMTKNEKYPVEIYYMHEGGGEGFLKVMWSWNGQEKIAIPRSYLVYSEENEGKWAWMIELDKDRVDKNRFQYIEGKNVIVTYEPGYFNAWPANNGIWIWGNEILVGFVRGLYRFDVLHHSIERSLQLTLLARSTDGGETWNVEDPDNFVNDGGKPALLKENINLANQNLALRFERNHFFYSYNRGKNWKGPFTFTGMEMGELTARTDYNIIDKNTSLFFLSIIDNKVKANLPDRAFCAKTTDGGKTFQFVSWMTETDTVRSVMSSTIRLDENHLVSALRRRYDPPKNEKPVPQNNWIDVYESFNNGMSWKFLSKVANTDIGTWNGNPPSLVKLNDGRLCVTYGFRGVPYGIRAKISSDNGKTWGKEIIIRDDAISKDMGYTRSVVRPDGKVVTTYYFTTVKNKEQHIAATIWDPNQIK